MIASFCTVLSCLYLLLFSWFFIYEWESVNEEDRLSELSFNVALFGYVVYCVAAQIDLSWIG